MTEEVKLFAEEILATLAREEKFVKDNDWTKPSKEENKTTLYDLHHTLISKRVNEAVKLVKLLNGDLSDKKMKALLKRLIGLFDNYDKKVAIYLGENDWTLNVGDGISLDRMKDEVAFQSKMTKERTSLKLLVQSIPTESDVKAIKVATLDNRPIPLPMREVIERNRPDIQEFVDKNLSKKK